MRGDLSSITGGLEWVDVKFDGWHSFIKNVMMCLKIFIYPHLYVISLKREKEIRETLSISILHHQFWTNICVYMQNGVRTIQPKA